MEKRVILLKTDIDNSQAIKASADLTAQIEREKLAIKALKKDTNNLTEATEDQKKEYVKLNASIKTAQEENRKYTKVLKDQNKEQKTNRKIVVKTNGSINSLRNALNINRDVYRSLTKSQRENSKSGKELLSIIKKQDKEYKDLSKTIGNNQVEVGNYSKAWQGLNKVMGALGITFAISSLVNLGKELITIANESKGVQFAFDRLGESGVRNFEAVKKSTRGTLSNLDIKRSLVEFDNFNISLDQSADLFEFLAVRATQTGQSIDKLKSSLVEGLSKESKLRIDNLGISTAQLNEELKKTPNFVQAVANIAKTEITRAGSVLDEAGNSQARWNAQIANSKEAIANNLTPAFSEFSAVVLSGLSKVIKGYRLLAKTKDELRDDFGIEVEKNASERYAKFVNDRISSELKGSERERERIKLSKKLQNEFLESTYNISENAKKITTDSDKEKVKSQSVALNSALNGVRKYSRQLIAEERDRENKLKQQRKSFNNNKSIDYEKKELTALAKLKIDLSNANKAKEILLKSPSDALKKEFIDASKEASSLEDQIQALEDALNGVQDSEVLGYKQRREVDFSDAPEDEVKKPVIEDIFANEIQALRDKGARESEIKIAQLEQDRIREVTNAKLTAEEVKKINDKYRVLEYQLRLDNSIKTAEKTHELLSGLGEFRTSLLNNEIQELDSKNERGLISEQTYARKKAEIQKKLFNQDKALNLGKAIINTARAVAQALPNLPLSILAGVLGGTQIATIASQKAPSVPGFVDGTTDTQPLGAKHTQPLGFADFSTHTGIISGTPNISMPNGDNMLATIKTGEAILNEGQQNTLNNLLGFDAIRYAVKGYANGTTSSGLENNAVKRNIVNGSNINNLNNGQVNTEYIVDVKDVVKGLKDYGLKISDATIG